MTSGGGAGGSGQVDILYVDVRARLDQLERQLGSVSATAGNAGTNAGHSFGDKFHGAMKIGFAAVGGAALALGVGVAAFIADGFKGVQEGQDAVAQLEAVIKSTGNVAGVSSQHLQDYALSIQQTTKFTAENAEATQSMLLTFTNIGSKGGVFDQATATALDMAQALGGDAKDSAMQLGKALNDPVKGISALSRVGVTFTADQKAVIKSLVDTGDTAGAQKVILAELAKEFGGSAVAAGQTFTGQMERAKNALGEIGESIAGRAMPAIQKLLDQVISHMPQIQKIVDNTVDAVGKAFDYLSKNVFPIFMQIFETLKPLFTGFGKQMGEVGTVYAPLFGAAIKLISGTVLPVLIQIFNAMKPVVADAGKTLADIGRVVVPIIVNAINFMKPVIAAIGPLFTATFGLIKDLWERVLFPVFKAIAPAFSGVFQVVAGVLAYAVQFITGVVKAISALFRGDMKGAVDALSGIFQAGVTAVVRIFRGLGSSIYNLIKAVAPQMADAAGEIIRGLIGGLERGGKQVIEAAQKLAGNIVGPLKQFLGIQSPSKVTTQFGLFVGQGLVDGMTQSYGIVQGAAAGLGGQVTKGVAGGIGAGSLGFGAKIGASIATGIEQGTPAVRSASGRLGQGVVSDLAKARSELEKTISTDAWTAGLKKLTDAQLLHAQAVARAAGDAQRYSAIKSELENRETTHTAAVQKNKDALKQQADQLAQNRKAIQDGLASEAYVEGLKRYSDAQLVVARNNAALAGDQSRFNVVLAEQKTRLSEAATAADELYQALSKASSVRFENTQNAADAGFRGSFGVGDAGLIKALASTTGLSIAKIRADVQGALADARVYAPESVAIIERVYAEALSHRKTVAAEEIATNQMILDSAEQSSRAATNAIAEFARTDQALADDAAVTVESLTETANRLFELGRNPEESGFIEFLNELISKGGQAAKAAQTVLAAMTLTETGARGVATLPGALTETGARRTGSRPVLTVVPALGQRAQPLTEVAARGKPIDPQAQEKADQLLLDRQKAFKENLEKIDFAKYVTGLADMTDAQLQQGLALATSTSDVERFNALTAELAKRGPLNATVKVFGVETGLKQLDLYKSALQGVGAVITQTFSDLVAGTGNGVQSILGNMTKMVLGIVKSVAQAVLAYEVQAAALALLALGTAAFDPTALFKAAAIGAAAAAIAGIAGGLESRLGGQASSGSTSAPASAPTDAPQSAAPNNNVLDIPNSAVTVTASPAFVAVFGGHVDRFGTYIDKLVTEGIYVRTDQGGTPAAGARSLSWELNSL